MKKKISTAKSRKKAGSKENSPRYSDIRLLLSEESSAFVKDMKVVMPRRLLSLIRHSLCGLSDDMQQFVCGNILMYLRTGQMMRFGMPHIDQIQGLILIELMNAKGSIICPPF